MLRQSPLKYARRLCVIRFTRLSTASDARLAATSFRVRPFRSTHRRVVENDFADNVVRRQHSSTGQTAHRCLRQLPESYLNAIFYTFKRP